MTRNFSFVKEEVVASDQSELTAAGIVISVVEERKMAITSKC